MNNKILLIVAGILGYVGYQKFLLSKKITVYFKNLSFNGGNFIKPIINIVLTISNPTKITADIQNISGKIFLDNLEIGKIENLRYISKILPNQSIDMDFNVEINNLTIATALLTENLKNKIIRFNGSLKVDFFSIPLNFEHKI
jgi:LEA14-like dessication related protein